MVNLHDQEKPAVVRLVFIKIHNEKLYGFYVLLMKYVVKIKIVDVTNLSQQNSTIIEI